MIYDEYNIYLVIPRRREPDTIMFSYNAGSYVVCTHYILYNTYIVNLEKCFFLRPRVHISIMDSGHRGL